jgi:hypothetical protein
MNQFTNLDAAPTREPPRPLSGDRGRQSRPLVENEEERERKRDIN